MLVDELKPKKDCADKPTRSLRLFIIQPAYNFYVKEDTIEKAIATLAKETKAHMHNEVGAMR